MLFFLISKCLQRCSSGFHLCDIVPTTGLSFFALIENTLREAGIFDLTSATRMKQSRRTAIATLDLKSKGKLGSATGSGNNPEMLNTGFFVPPAS